MLRPLLPTWNPPPTRPPQPEELEVSTRVRLKKEDRWWAATVREVGQPGEPVKIGYDGWPGRHDEMIPRDSDRLYMHESFHPDYSAAPLPQRYQRPAPVDDEGNLLPVTPRAPRPKVFDPEKERMKRALRPPLPYNPEKERLKRLLRGQHAPPMVEEPQRAWEEEEQQHQQQAPAVEESRAAPTEGDQGSVAAAPSASPASAASAAGGKSAAPAVPAASAAHSSAPPPPGPPPPAAAVERVEWVEVEGQDGARAFRHIATSEVRLGTPLSGWVELAAEGGARYYWHVGRQVTQWTPPQ